MANPVFPNLVLDRGGLDSQQFSVTLEDVAMKSEMEGGYVVSRAKHTRKPRKTFNVAYKGISDADRATLDSFYSTVGGGSVIFDWTDPSAGTTWQVRFEGELQFSYAGKGTTKLWNVTFKVRQA